MNAVYAAREQFHCTYSVTFINLNGTATFLVTHPRNEFRQWHRVISEVNTVTTQKSVTYVGLLYIINNNNTRTIFIVLSSWPQAIARVHSVHLMTCRTAHKQLSTLRPSHLTWAVSPPVGSYRLHPPSPFIIITQSEKLIIIYRPTYGRRLSWPRHCRKVHTAHAQGCKMQWFLR